jgi:probable rRNA maturation factor
MTRIAKKRREGSAAKNCSCPRHLAVGNYQDLRPVNLRLLRQIVHALLRETWPEAPVDLTVNVVSAPEITRVNETFLRHKGSTDVITFDYADGAGRESHPAIHNAPGAPASERRHAGAAWLHGEILVCMDEALAQARRFRTTWQSELVRYVVHGVLHLLGHDDRRSGARRSMKQAESALLCTLAGQFSLRSLGPL